MVRGQPGGAAAPGGTARAVPARGAFRGRQNAKLQYAVLAAAAVHGGTEPNLLDEVAAWQADDFWQYAMYAAVAYIRAAASRAGVPVPRHARNWTNALANRRPSADFGQLAMLWLSLPYGRISATHARCVLCGRHQVVIRGFRRLRISAA